MGKIKQEDSELNILEEAGIAYDPTVQFLDLTKEEKRRVTALFLAINAYQNLIIKEADYLREVADLARRNECAKIQPATIDAMVQAAVQFDNFILGGGHTDADTAVGGAMAETGAVER